MKRTISIGHGLLAAAMLILSWFIQIQSVQAQPCLTNYTYRVPIYVSNLFGSSNSDVEIELSLNTSDPISQGKMQSSGQDIRFIDRFGNNINYWIEASTINKMNTKIWVRLNSLIGYSVDTIYMFYGNSSASPASDASATFSLFDEFNGTTLGANWTTCGSGTVSVTGGNLTLTSTSSDDIILKSTSFTSPVIVEAGVVSRSGSDALLGTMNASGDGYAMIYNSSGMTLNRINNTVGCFNTSSYSSSSTSGSVSGSWIHVWRSTGSQSTTWNGGSLTGTNSSYTLTSSCNGVLASMNGAGSMVVDYVKVRKYLSSVPGISVGIEQNMNFSITASYSSPLCIGDNLTLSVNSVNGATYKWTGPNGFSSNQREPVITGVSANHAGRYDIVVEIPTSCATKSSSVNVNVFPKAKGGAVSGSQTVCEGANTGQLTLSGHVGNVVRWERATSATGLWTSISNTALSQGYNNLDTTTYFRAIVGNGGCSEDSSSVAIITVTPASNGGSLTGADTVCATSNAGILNVSNYLGNITKWQSSTNGNLWTDISNFGTSHLYSNLSQSTYFRVEVRNSNCNVAYSNEVLVTVNAASVGGSVTGGTTVCSGANSGNLILSNHVGDVMGWEYSATGNAPWTYVQHASDTFQYTNVSANTHYRALVKNGMCAVAISAPATIQIVKNTAAGTIKGSGVVCETSNGGALNLTNYNGSVVKWQESQNGTIFTDINSTNTSHSYSNLTDTTWFRAIVASGSCPLDTTPLARIDVNKSTTAGYITGNNPVCSGTNTTELNLNAQRGDVQQWQYSSNGAAPWNTVASTASDLTVTNLNKSLFYRAQVKNGVCAIKNTNPVKIQVDAHSVAGQMSAGKDLCELGNTGILTITQSVGAITNWQIKKNGGSWVNTGNTNTYKQYNNVLDTTSYRVFVKNGVCPTDTSEVTTLNVNQATVAGKVSGSTEHCSQTNSGSVQLQDFRGAIARWETSTDLGDSWNTISGSGLSKSYINMSQTTLYRAIVQSGVCPEETSDLAIVQISQPSDAGALSTAVGQVCEEANSGVIAAANYTGNILGWMHSEDDVQYAPIANNTSREFFFGLKDTRYYKVIVQNKGCTPDTSDALSIQVSKSSEMGRILTENEVVCEGSPGGQIWLESKNGSVVKWETATELNGPWQSWGDQKDTQNVGVINDHSFFRVTVQNGVCPEAISSAVRIQTDESTKPSLLSGPSSVCLGDNAGTVRANDVHGSLLTWEMSQDNGNTFTPTSNQGLSLVFENLTQNTQYRVVTKNGICSAVHSPVFSILMDEIPAVDFEATNLCDGEISVFTETATINSGRIEELTWHADNGMSGQGNQWSVPFVEHGTYNVTLTATSDKGCKATSMKPIVVHESPMVNFSITGTRSEAYGCFTENLVLENKTIHGDLDNLNWSWNFGEGNSSNDANPVYAYNADGRYEITLLASTRSGCSDSLTKPFTVLPYHAPKILNQGTVSKGISFILQAEGGSMYQWTPEGPLNAPQESKTEARITEDTWFYVEAMDHNGCPGIDSVWIEVEHDYEISPANVITPEDNGSNDAWVVQNLENYPDNKVAVYDRWGRVVFEKEGYQNDWKATNKNGQTLSDGTYYYVISFNGSDKVLKGAITILNNK